MENSTNRIKFLDYINTYFWKYGYIFGQFVTQVIQTIAIR